MFLRLYPADQLPRALEARWWELCDAQPVRVSPYLVPETAKIAASVVPGTMVAVISDGDRPVAFIPFERRGRRGMPVAHDTGDGDGLVAEPGVTLDLPTILQGAGLRSLEWLHRNRESASSMEPYDHMVREAARVDLSSGFRVYAKNLETDGSKILKQAARKMRRLEREAGPVEFTLSDDHGLASTLVTWKAAQLRARGEACSLEGSRAADLISSFGAQTGDTPLRSIFSTLRAGGQVIAMNWGLAAGGLFVSSLPSHDERYSKCSPGLLIQIEVLRHIEELEIDEVDLGLGLNQAKQRLLTHTVPYGSGAVYAHPVGQRYRQIRTAARRALHGA